MFGSKIVGEITPSATLPDRMRTKRTEAPARSGGWGLTLRSELGAKDSTE